MNKLIIRGRVYKRWRANGTFIRSLINLRELSPTIIFENYQPSRIMDMASVCDNCILCKEPVREREQGIQCHGCLKWNHRTCNIGK